MMKSLLDLTESGSIRYEYAYSYLSPLTGQRHTCDTDSAETMEADIAVLVAYRSGPHTPIDIKRHRRTIIVQDWEEISND